MKQIIAVVSIIAFIFTGIVSFPFFIVAVGVSFDAAETWQCKSRGGNHVDFTLQNIGFGSRCVYEK